MHQGGGMEIEGGMSRVSTRVRAHIIDTRGGRQYIGTLALALAALTLVLVVGMRPAGADDHFPLDCGDGDVTCLTASNPTFDVSGVDEIVVELWGGGGGGGGTDSGTAGGGGGGGAYVRAVIDVSGASTCNVVVGGGGLAGSAGAQSSIECGASGQVVANPGSGGTSGSGGVGGAVTTVAGPVVASWAGAAGGGAPTNSANGNGVAGGGGAGASAVGGPTITSGGGQGSSSADASAGLGGIGTGGGGNGGAGALMSGNNCSSTGASPGGVPGGGGGGGNSGTNCGAVGGARGEVRIEVQEAAPPPPPPSSVNPLDACALTPPALGTPPVSEAGTGDWAGYTLVNVAWTSPTLSAGPYIVFVAGGGNPTINNNLDNIVCLTDGAVTINGNGNNTVRAYQGGSITVTINGGGDNYVIRDVNGATSITGGGDNIVCVSAWSSTVTITGNGDNTVWRSETGVVSPTFNGTGNNQTLTGDPPGCPPHPAAGTSEPPEADPPTVTKAPHHNALGFTYGYEPINGQAGWLFTISNPGPDDRIVRIEDTATRVSDASALTFVGVNLLGQAINCDIQLGVTTVPCIVPGEQTITLLFLYRAPQACEPYDVQNTAVASFGAVPGDFDDWDTINFGAFDPLDVTHYSWDLGAEPDPELTAVGAGPSTVTVPGDEDECAQPTVTKAPIDGQFGYTAGYNSDLDRAGWRITVFNDHTAPQTVTIVDADVTGLIESVDGCDDGDITDTEAGLVCSAPGEGFLSVFVYLDVTEVCTPSSVNNTVEAFLGESTNEADALEVTNPTTPVSVPASGEDCPNLTITKTAFGTGELQGRPPGNEEYDFVDGFDSEFPAAAWVITVTNPADAEQTVLIQDTDISDIVFHSSNLASACGAIGQFYDDITGTGVECDVPAGGDISFVVVLHLEAEECAVTNSLQGWLVGDTNTLLDLSNATDVPVWLNLSDCATPTIDKEAAGWNDDVASWVITVDNTDAGTEGTTIARSVRIIDAGATLAGDTVPADACTAVTDGWDCEIPANSTLVLNVTTEAPADCIATTAYNSATLYLAENLQNPISFVDDVEQAVPYDLALCPEITKVAQTFDGDFDGFLPAWVVTGYAFAWDIEIDNDFEGAADRVVLITDSVVVPNAFSYETSGDNSCSVGDVAGDFVCEVAAGTTLTLTLVQYTADRCLPDTLTNSITSILIDRETYEGTLPAGVEGFWPGGHPDVCPVVTKTGHETGPWSPYTWTITIDNSGEDRLFRESIVLTDAGLTGMEPDDHCELVGDEIVCEDVPAGEVIELTVTRSTVTMSCVPRTRTNVIEAILVDGFGLDIGPAVHTAEARVLGYMPLCHPILTFPIPTEVPDPTDPGVVTGCSNPEVPHAGWSTDTTGPGWTIAIWGGGHVAEFPQPLATTYWTLVDGQWVGYIPGIQSPTLSQSVNAAFFAAFPDGMVPACQPFVVFNTPTASMMMSQR